MDDVEVTIEKVLDGYPLFYCNGSEIVLLRGKSQKDIMGTVTSTCPTCKKEWSRETYLDIPLAILSLAMCDECSNDCTTIVGSNKEWN